MEGEQGQLVEATTGTESIEQILLALIPPARFTAVGSEIDDYVGLAAVVDEINSFLRVTFILHEIPQTVIPVGVAAVVASIHHQIRLAFVIRDIDLHVRIAPILTAVDCLSLRSKERTQTKNDCDD